MTTLYHFEHASDFDALGVLIDTVPEYDESIETASDDKLRSWILSKGITAKELDAMLDSGFFTLRDVASDLELEGHVFS